MPCFIWGTRPAQLVGTGASALGGGAVLVDRAVFGRGAVFMARAVSGDRAVFGLGVVFVARAVFGRSLVSLCRTVAVLFIVSSSLTAGQADAGQSPLRR